LATNGKALRLPPRTIGSSQVWDAHDGRHVRLTDLDLAALTASGRFPANGTVFAYGASIDGPDGFRLRRGAELARSLTFASPLPVWIEGACTTHGKKPAAVLAPTVHLLSSRWDDSKTAGSLPIAASTSFNVSILTGITPPGGRTAAWRDFVRLHEDWSRHTLRWRGSLVNAFERPTGESARPDRSDVASEPWLDWAFDPALLRAQPPLTPALVDVLRVWWDDGSGPVVAGPS